MRDVTHAILIRAKTVNNNEGDQQNTTMRSMSDENKSKHDHEIISQQFSLRSRYDLPQVGDCRLGIDLMKTQSAVYTRQRSVKQITH